MLNYMLDVCLSLSKHGFTKVLLPQRLHWSRFSKQGIYGYVEGSSQEKGKQMVAAAVEGLANIYVDLHERAIPPRVDRH